TEFETVEPYPLVERTDELAFETANHYQVKKMRFAGSARQPDRSVIVMNNHLTLEGIPDEVHRYIVNGKSALDWVIVRFQQSRDQDTGIVNDPNEWSDDPNYILELVKRVVTVSVETIKIVDALRQLDDAG